MLLCLEAAAPGATCQLVEAKAGAGYSSHMHVFTYGTLMFPEVWRAVVGRHFESVEGRAAGYAIFRVRDAVFPGILAAAEGSHVSGVVYLDVDLPTLQRLDAFEDAFYERRAIPVDYDDGR